MHNNAILYVPSLNRKVLIGLPAKSYIFDGLFWPIGSCLYIQRNGKVPGEMWNCLRLTRWMYRASYIICSQVKEVPWGQTSLSGIIWDLHCPETAWTHQRSLASIYRRMGKLWTRPFILRVSPLCSRIRIAEHASWIFTNIKRQKTEGGICKVRICAS